MAEKNIDNQITNLLADVEGKLAKLTAPKVNYKTNCTLRHEETTKQINIQTLGSEESIVNCLAEILSKKMAHDKACEELGINLTFKINGFHYCDWVMDLKQRLSQLQFGKEYQKLTGYKERIEGLVSEEQRRGIEFEKLMKEIL